MKTKIILIVVLLVAVGVTWFWLQQNQTKNIEKTLPKGFNIGLVNTCRKIPPFIKQLHMRQPAIDSKQQGHAGGLLIRDIANNQTWQHPSWKKSGHLAAFERDNHGNIFVAPLPYVSLSQNPPEKQNQIYKIDANTAEMSLYLKMPSKHIPNTKNPFGTMGMFYDCDTNSLYVTSVAGSTPRVEKGVIYQIDLANHKVVSQFDATDAIGVAVFNTLKGKKLYFGSARAPHIYSIDLDAKGNFISNKKYEFSLSTIQGGDTTVAKKILISKQAGKFILTVKETEFGFRLLAENNLNRKKYNFSYSLVDDKWTFIGSSPE